MVLCGPADPTALKTLKLQSVDLMKLFWAAVTLIRVNSTLERSSGSETYGQAEVDIVCFVS